LGTFNHANYHDRIKHSAAAKAALVEKLRNRPGPDDPRVAAIQAERKAIAEARQARFAEKERQREEQLAREAEENRLREEAELAAAIAREEQLERERQAADAARLERASRAVNDMAAQKDRRDARFAARRARQKAR
jgi:hypothetical protein